VKIKKSPGYATDTNYSQLAENSMTVFAKNFSAEL